VRLLQASPLLLLTGARQAASALPAKPTEGTQKSLLLITPARGHLSLAPTPLPVTRTRFLSVGTTRRFLHLLPLFLPRFVLSASYKNKRRVLRRLIASPCVPPRASLCNSAAADALRRFTPFGCVECISNGLSPVGPRLLCDFSHRCSCTFTP
jgi:hypothetical protein